MRFRSIRIFGITIAIAMASAMAMGVGLVACGTPASTGSSSSGAVAVESGSSGGDSSTSSVDSASSAASDGKSEKSTSVPIELEDEDGLVIQCPTSAPAGEVVQVHVYAVLDAGLRVAVNGDENFGSFVSAQEYEFVMPNAPVTVQVYTVDEGYGA